MRLIRAVSALLVALCAGTVGAVVGAAPAQAGGWATTVLDPVPATFEPGKSYTIGFWVLQHGSHPYDGDLEPVGLQVDGPNGRRVFTATALPERAHYVTSIVVPAAGTYTLTGQQGIFQPYRIGTVAVPGGLTALPVPPPMKFPAEQLPWTDVRPPEMPVDTNRDPFDETAALPVQPATAPAQNAATEPTASQITRPTTTVLAALAATGLVLGLLLYGRRRRVSSRS
ncbi:hypothetical protein GCM10009557_46300 [Virgisporangium ochraceum]|uniref:LPXTG-motif cell wall anchor domain protein n=1 Tax=Virgisporangium ochraceum TaxID=65505 RepID=A0A8J4EEJ7_9ACTN|nr:hypothetical protein [Virgisporangium ochraceum]GIJ69102.1 hypothetical protein Voc01_040190 [Virgisporangium ochraceum]